MAVEHHLLRLALVGAHEQQSAVAEPDVGDLYHHRDAIQLHDFAAPVELVGFTRRKTQRYMGGRHRLTTHFGPAPGIATNGVVTTAISATTQLFEDPDQRQSLARRRVRVRRQQPVEFVLQRSDLRKRPRPSLVPELGRSRPDHLADDLARQLQLTKDRLDRLPQDENARRIFAIPTSASMNMDDSGDPPSQGSRSNADHPESGPLFHANSQAAV